MHDFILGERVSLRDDRDNIDFVVQRSHYGDVEWFQAKQIQRMEFMQS